MKGVPLPKSAGSYDVVIGPAPGVQYDRARGPYQDTLFDVHKFADLLFTGSLVGSNLPKKVTLHNDGPRCCTYVAVWVYTEPAMEWWFDKLRSSGFTPTLYAQQDVNPEYGDLYVWFRLGER